MENRFILIVVLFFVLGSATVSTLNTLSYTFKSIFYGVGMTVLIVLGLVSLFKCLKKTKH